MSNKTSDTAVIIQTDAWKAKVYLGLGGIIALVILGFVYRFEAGLVALAIGGACAARVALGAYHQHRLNKFERRRLEAEVSKAESEAVQAKARSYFVEVNSGTFQLAGISVERFYPAVSASRLLADLPPLPALPEPAAAPSHPQLRRLLDFEFVHLLVVGPSGSGKSTVLCHLIDNEPANTEVIVLDPHARFNAWPARSGAIVGDGRNYEAINSRLFDLIRQMDRRYNGLESTGQKVLIVCDEWLSVVDQCLAAVEFFNTIGSEARKVNMSLVISSISATVDDLAVSGAIRDNLSQITLSPTLKAKNQALLRLSRKESEAIELPGLYHRPPALAAPPAFPAQPPVDEFDPINLDAGPVAELPEPTELRIFELYQEGKSLRAIYAETNDGKTPGGRQIAEIKDILAKFGVKFE